MTEAVDYRVNNMVAHNMTAMWCVCVCVCVVRYLKFPAELLKIQVFWTWTD